MNPLVIVLLAGPLIAFATAVNFALLNGGEWSPPEIAGVLMLAAMIGAAFARIAGLPF
jgi:hypothetical protein